MLVTTHNAQKRWWDWRTVQQLFSFLPRSPDPSILCIHHRSLTSLDTADNCEADQGAHSVHDLLIHYD